MHFYCLNKIKVKKCASVKLVRIKLRIKLVQQIDFTMMILICVYLPLVSDWRIQY